MSNSGHCMQPRLHLLSFNFCMQKSDIDYEDVNREKHIKLHIFKMCFDKISIWKHRILLDVPDVFTLTGLLQLPQSKNRNSFICAATGQRPLSLLRSILYSQTVTKSPKPNTSWTSSLNYLFLLYPLLLIICCVCSLGPYLRFICVCMWVMSVNT